MPEREDHFRGLLEQRLASLQSLAETAESNAAVVELDQTRQGRLSRMDALQQQAIAQASNERRLQEIGRIKSALIRLDQEEYGYCLTCGDEIPDGRLEIDPTATQCVTCADKTR